MIDYPQQITQALTKQLVSKFDDEFKRMLLLTLTLVVESFNPDDLMTHAAKITAQTCNGHDYTAYYDVETYGKTKPLFKYSTKITVGMEQGWNLTENTFKVTASIG